MWWSSIKQEPVGQTSLLSTFLSSNQWLIKAYIDDTRNTSCVRKNVVDMLHPYWDTEPALSLRTPNPTSPAGLCIR